jgi:hypothetical protein
MVSEFERAIVLAEGEFEDSKLDHFDGVDIGRNGRRAERSSFWLQQPAHVCQPGLQRRIDRACGHIRQQPDRFTPEIRRNRRAAITD